MPKRVEPDALRDREFLEGTWEARRQAKRRQDAEEETLRQKRADERREADYRRVMANLDRALERGEITEAHHRERIAANNARLARPD